MSFCPRVGIAVIPGARYSGICSSWGDALDAAQCEYLPEELSSQCESFPVMTSALGSLASSDSNRGSHTSDDGFV